MELMTKSIYHIIDIYKEKGERKSMDVLAVNMKTFGIFDFLRVKDGESESQLLNRANISKEKDICRWKKHVKERKGDKKKEAKFYLRAAQEAEYRIMSWDEFQQEKRKFVLGNEKMQKISEYQWDEAFCVLPPYKYCVINGVEMFCSSEMFTGTYT